MKTTKPELELLCEYLDSYRGAIRWKVDGLSLDEATQSPVPSGTSLAGILKHMAFVERFWFQKVMDGRDVAYEPGDHQFSLTETETVDSLVSFFDKECAVSREVVAGRDVMEMVPFRDGELSIREIIVHMIEETARHCGHMDILREQIDGSTGGFPPDELPSD